MVSFEVVFDIVVKVIGSLLLVALVLGAIVLAVVVWVTGPWWVAAMVSLVPVLAILGCIGLMLDARDQG